MSVRPGDRIVEKRPDGHYDLIEVNGGRRVVQSNVTWGIVRDFARQALRRGGNAWYRRFRDPDDHLEPLSTGPSRRHEALRSVQDAGATVGDFCIVPEGVFFSVQRTAEIFAEQHNMDLIALRSPITGWLATIRRT